MMKGLLLLLLLWKPYSAEGNKTLNIADYYNEDYYSFVIRINEIQQNVLLKDLFNNLEKGNTTDKCTQDLKIYRDSIDSQEEWAISLLDSSGLSFSGLLSGSTLSLGNYKQCLSTSPKNFSSSYCTVEFNIFYKRNFMKPWVSYDVPVKFALCLPDTCNNKQLGNLLEPSTSDYDKTVKVECQPRRPGFTVADYIAMSLFTLVWIVIFSTTLPVNWIPIKNKAFHQIWDCFSFKRNLATLIKTKSESTPLSSLEGLRVLSQCTVVCGHLVLSQAFYFYPVLNKFSLRELPRSWEGAILAEATVCVDTFFVIGGLLLTWSILEKKIKLNLFNFYAYRFLRLTPAYVAVILITATFSDKLCDGPLCNIIFDNEKQSCATYWWTNLLYINNFYLRLIDVCLPQSWFLAADWQLYFFIAPFVVIVINKWPQHIYKVINAILLTSVVTTFLVSYLDHLPADDYFSGMEDSISDFMRKLYEPPYVRAGPWAIGMLCGVFLHNFKNNKIKLSKKMNVIAWFLSVLGICFTFEFVLIFIKLQSIRYGVWAALYNSIHRNVWAASISWIIFSSETQKSGFIGRFLRWNFFQPWAKLTYSTYLIHSLIIKVYLQSAYGYNNVTLATQIPIAIGITFLSYAAGFLLYLSFEAPTSRLNKILFRKEIQEKQNGIIKQEINSAPQTQI